MRLKNYLNEANKIKVKTEKDQTKHGHIAIVNENGDGKTTETVGTANHIHKVFEWVLQPKNGHIHNLES